MPSYVVTGANRGLGYAFVTHLAAIPGNIVLGLARKKQALEERLAKDGIKNVHVLAADITDVKALKAAADETAKITGGLRATAIGLSLLSRRTYKRDVS
ncbi:hypothetical protein LTR17_024708 [Elasticomyces elasticus]|nr:hypothetical protein LTR17_024708 [Elasticomyces elasticus]